MKHCPKCNRTYPDEMRFCLTDGGELVSDAPSIDFSKTVAWIPPKDMPREPPVSPVMPAAPVTPARDAPSYPAQAQPAPPPSQPVPPQSQPAVSRPPAAYAPPVTKTKKAAKTSMILGIISLLLTLLLGPIGTIRILAEHFYRLIDRLQFSLELLGLLILVGLPLISILFGAIGLFMAFRWPERYGGKIIAPVGITLSLLSIFIFAAVFLYGLSRFF